MRPLRVVQRGLTDYAAVWREMRTFTEQRDGNTVDEVWLTQHHPVFTQGRAGRAEHVLMAGDIPVLATDRGGQVTYHGPGQIVAYPLLDLARLQLNVRGLVTTLEQSMIRTLGTYGVRAAARADAPGVYVDGNKVGSLGLRIRRGCSYHGLSLNVTMDLEPFSRINPCGMAGLQMTQLSELVQPPPTVNEVEQRLVHELLSVLGMRRALD